MQIVRKAVLKHPDKPAVHLSLFRVEKKVYRWRRDSNGGPFEEASADCVTVDDAVKLLRVAVETDVAFIGTDLTILPVEPPPEERAAAAIWKMLAPLTLPEHEESWKEKIADVIRQETAIDKLVGAAGELMAYYVLRAKHPKPPGLDMAMGGLAMNLLEALEIAQNQDYKKFKDMLKEPVNKIQVYGGLPSGVKQ